MKSIKSLLALSAVALAVAAPVAQAGIGDTYQSSFQGATFTFFQSTATHLQFTITGSNPLTGDWATAGALASFDLKDLWSGNSFIAGTANGPGAVNLAGLNTQLNANAINCLAQGSPPGSICFNIAPDQAIVGNPFSFVYQIEFASALSISSLGPHLQIAWVANPGDTSKVGSLYSQNIPGNHVPEPDSAALALLALGLLGGGFWTRRKA